MSVPAWPRFVEPVLKHLASASAPVPRKALRHHVPLAMDLTAEELREPAGAGRHTKAVSRTGWALSHSHLAGLVHSPKRAYWEITAAGRSLLSRYPGGIPETELKAIERAARASRNRGDGCANLTAEDGGLEMSPDTPDERLRAAYGELRQSVREELLDLIRAGSPTFFEGLVLDLLHALGYGFDRTSLETTAAGADGGIDGVISLDRLGLEKVYVQAKRYAEDHNVGRPTIQAFLGALAGRRATKGVFLTTSSFSKDARAFAASASDSLVLVDGQQLAELMMDHGVGVTPRETFTLVGVDGDYFEDS